jgi:hypothetical protein
LQDDVVRPAPAQAPLPELHTRQDEEEYLRQKNRAVALSISGDVQRRRWPFDTVRHGSLDSATVIIQSVGV